MSNSPGHTGGIHRETLEWMGRQLACIRSEAIALSGRIRNGDAGDLEAEIASLEARVESYRAKMEFEKRNARLK